MMQESVLGLFHVAVQIAMGTQIWTLIAKRVMFLE